VELVEALGARGRTALPTGLPSTIIDVIHDRRRSAMTRTYKVIDADGHILEPLDLWDRYMDPAYRERAPRMILDDNGKERLLIEGG